MRPKKNLINQINAEENSKRKDDQKGGLSENKSIYEQLLDELNYQQSTARQLFKQDPKKLSLFEEQKRINCIGVNYCQPQIKSKYFLAANLKYLFKIKYKDCFKRYDLTDGNAIEYEYLINGINEGFDSHYNIDLHDQNFLQQLYQSEKIKDKDKIPKVHDLVNMELFLILLEQLEKYQSIRFQLQDEIIRIESESKRLKPDGKLNEHLSHLEDRYNKLQAQYSQLEKKKQDVLRQIEVIARTLSDKDSKEFDLYFNYEEVSAKQMSKVSTLKKQKINREKYFIKSQDVNNYEPELKQDKFKIDLAENAGKKNILDRIENKQEREIEYLAGANKDPIQKNWFKESKLEVYNIKPMQERQNKKGFILVDQEQAKDHTDFFINMEIQRFKRFQLGEQIKKERNIAASTLSKEQELEIHHEILRREIKEQNPDLSRDPQVFKQLFEEALNKDLENKNRMEKERANLFNNNTNKK